MTAASIRASLAQPWTPLPVRTKRRLPTVRRLWEAIGAQSDREGWPAVRLLSALFEHEIAERESRRLARHRLESNLAADKTLANFDFEQVPTVSKAHIAALGEGDVWIEKGANLLLFGPSDHAT